MPQFPMSLNFNGPFNLTGTPNTEYGLMTDDYGNITLVPLPGGELPTPTIDGALLIADVEANTFDQNIPTGDDGTVVISPTAGNLDFSVNQSALSLDASSQLTGVLPTPNGGTGSALFTFGTATMNGGSGGFFEVIDSTISADSVVVVSQAVTVLAEEFAVDLVPGTGFIIYSSNDVSTATVFYIRVN